MKPHKAFDAGGKSRSGGAALSRQIYQVLIDRIITFELKPYDQLSELKISEELGVSRTPIREALVRLSELGLVDIYPQRGTVVTPLRDADLVKSQFLREAIEIAIVKRALEQPKPEELVARLRAEITIQSTFAKIGDMERFYDSDEAFHALIAAHAGIPAVTSEVNRLKVHMDRFRHLMISGIESLDEVLRQHVTIVDKIEAGDAAGCEEAMKAHLRRILAFSDKAAEKFPEYFEQSER